MPTNPAAFREWLSGECLYSDPPSWTCDLSPDRIAIVPSWKTTAIASVFFLFFFGFATFVFCVSHGDRSIFGIAKKLFGVAIGILAVGTFGYWLMKCLIGQFKGPYLIYSPSSRILSLPREHLVMPMGDVLGWRLVSGNWVGPDLTQTKWSYPIAELQLIVKTSDGVIAYAVVGGKVNSITDKAHQISRETGMPIEVIGQHQGISTPAPSTRMQWWRTRGM